MIYIVLIAVYIVVILYFQSIGEFHPIPDQHIPGQPGSRLSYEQSVATLSSTELMRHSGEIAMKDVVFEPQEILALFASSDSQSRGETLMLRDIHTMNQSIFIVVETTCPIHKSSTRNAPNHQNPEVSIPTTGSVKAHGNVVLDMKYHDSNEMDESHDALPEWLKNDLEDANIDQPNQPKGQNGGKRRLNKRSDHKYPPRKAKTQHSKQISQEKGYDHSDSDLTNDERNKYVERLEKEYNKKRKELLLEAENAVRVREEAFNQELVRLNQELERHKQIQRQQVEQKKKSVTEVSKNTPSSQGWENEHQNGNIVASESKNITSSGCVIQ